MDAAGYSQLNAAGLVACEAAYRDGEEWYQAMKKYVADNIAFTKEFVEKNLPGVNMVEHEGTYLIWLDFNGLGLCTQELETIGDICYRHHVIVVSDEIHADFAFQGKHQVFANLKKEYEEMTIACTSPSKTFNLAGLQTSNIFIPNQ